MGRFSHHEPCPKCRENGRDRRGNNLGVYDDGSKYCYSCGYHSHGKPTIPVAIQLEQQLPSSLSLPDDVEPYYPAQCLVWVGQYELNKNDLYTNKCLWSEHLQRLIFPIYSSEGRELLAWQGRYFGTDRAKPKWFSYGKLDTVFHIFNRERSRGSLVVVEDIVSAIKLGKVGHAVMPLFGSYISQKKMASLKLLTAHLTIWLDPDKYKEAVKFCKEANIISLPCTVVNTDKDPKEVSFEELDRTLKSCYNNNTPVRE